MLSVPLQLSTPLVVFALIAVAGVVLVALGVRELWVGLRYRRTRPVPVGALAGASDRVLVSGRARRADEVLSAPLSGTDCFVYTWRVSDFMIERGFNGELRTQRANAGTGREAVPFLLTDDTGSVLVDPAGAELRLAEERIDDPVADPVAQSGFSLTDPFGGDARDREYYESRVDDGETITVRARVAPGDEELRRVHGVSSRLTGGDALVDDGTPAAAARRAFVQAAYTGLTGLFLLGILAFLFFA